MYSCVLTSNGLSIQNAILSIYGWNPLGDILMNGEMSAGDVGLFDFGQGAIVDIADAPWVFAFALDFLDSRSCK
jgi:hypothetical protein